MSGVVSVSGRSLTWFVFAHLDCSPIPISRCSPTSLLCHSRLCSSEKDLPRLSSLGHFLKGSSAALGVTKVQAICETIQNNGKLRDEVADEDITEEEALKRIKELLRNAELEYRVAKAWFLKLYPGDAPKAEE